MYNILVNSESFLEFRKKGEVCITNFDMKIITNFRKELLKHVSLIKFAFSELFENITCEVAENLARRIAKTILVINLDNYEKDIKTFEKVKEKTCIVQLKKDVRAENIFREEEILKFKDDISQFSQISRTIKRDENKKICFIKVQAILKLQNKNLVIQMVYIKPGETRFYEYEKNFIFFIHPIFVKEIIVNDYKTFANKAFCIYFMQKYPIERFYTEQEQVACNNIRKFYDQSASFITSLFLAQNSLDLDELYRCLYNIDTNNLSEEY